MDYSVTSNPISPTDVNFREFTLASNTTLIWPFAGIDGTNTIARVMVVSSVTGNPALLMPPANQGQLGYTYIIANLGASLFYIQDNSGGAIDSVAAGQVKVVNLRSGSNAAGTWLSSTLGATTSTANAALLAGFGLTVLTSTLNSNVPSTSFSASQSFGIGDRAQLYIWTGGVGTASFDSSMTLTNGWWMAFRNAGTGTLTFSPSDSIDGAASESLNVGDSCLLFSTGGVLYTVGLGRSITTTDTRTVVNVAGNTDVTLSSTQYANNIINFIGVLTGNINVIFPSTVKNYELSNSTTGGFTLTAKTAAGTGVVIPQGGASIVTSDGTNVIAANSSSAGTVTSITAGTGLNGGTITGSGTISIATTGVTAGTYGDSTHYPTFTTNAQGQMTVAGTQSLSVPGTPPTGSMLMYGSSTAPTGWLNCDGSAISRATYASLFAIIGTSYGVGDGSTTFNVPFMSSRSPIGYGTGSGLTVRNMGDSGGEENHTLTSAENASHTHTGNTNGGTISGTVATQSTSGSGLLNGPPLAANAVANGTAAVTGSASAQSFTTASSGSGTAHNTMHPYLTVNFIIKT